MTSRIAILSMIVTTLLFVVLLSVQARASVFSTEYKIEVEGTNRNINAPISIEKTCKAKRISEADAKYYFQHAKIISLEKAIRKLEWPACHFYGKINGNGNIIKWKIWPSGLGMLERDFHPIEMLYCKECAEMLNKKH